MTLPGSYAHLTYPASGLPGRYAHPTYPASGLPVAVHYLDAWKLPMVGTYRLIPPLNYTVPYYSSPLPPPATRQASLSLSPLEYTPP